MKYIYKPVGTCSTKIEFDINNSVVSNIKFTNGCNGNLQGIASFAEGLTASEIAKKCAGIKCGFKNTSCPNELSKAVLEASTAEMLNEKKN